MTTTTATATQTTTRKPRQRKKPVRLVGIVRQGGETFLRITLDGEPTHYRLTALSSDMGRAFRLEKMAAGSFIVVEKTYDLCLSANDCSSCECKGFIRWSHCKHLESLSALIEAKRL
jgi:hypothetical protein